MTAATFPTASLAIQLAELKREKKMRGSVYPHWIQTGKIKQAVADYQCNALDGAIATLERLVAAAGQPGRVEVFAALRETLLYLPSEGPATQLRQRITDMLAKVPAENSDR